MSFANIVANLQKQGTPNPPFFAPKIAPVYKAIGDSFLDNVQDVGNAVSNTGGTNKANNTGNANVTNNNTNNNTNKATSTGNSAPQPSQPKNNNNNIDPIPLPVNGSRGPASPGDALVAPQVSMPSTNPQQKPSFTMGLTLIIAIPVALLVVGCLLSKR